MRLLDVALSVHLPGNHHRYCVLLQSDPWYKCAPPSADIASYAAN